MVRFLWICLGGAVGTGARYLISVWAARFGVFFPYGTLREGAWLLGILNVVVMVGACLAAGIVGLASARWLVGN